MEAALLVQHARREDAGAERDELPLVQLYFLKLVAIDGAARVGVVRLDELGDGVM